MLLYYYNILLIKFIINFHYHSCQLSDNKNAKCKVQNSRLQSENQNSETKAYEYAMFLLNIRLRTEGELRGKMGEKGYKGEVVDGVMGRLKDTNYVNDQRFAEVYLENLKKYKSWGYSGLKKKKKKKRLPADIIEKVLSEALSEEEELEIAKRLLKKQNSLPLRGRDKGGVSREDKSRLARKLAAKGFRGSVVSELIF